MLQNWMPNIHHPCQLRKYGCLHLHLCATISFPYYLFALLCYCTFWFVSNDHYVTKPKIYINTKRERGDCIIHFTERLSASFLKYVAGVVFPSLSERHLPLRKLNETKKQILSSNLGNHGPIT